MTTEQMDWLDDERAGRHPDTASRRAKQAAEIRAKVADAMDVPVETLDPEDYASQAEEPIEQRLERAWLNGFREGFMGRSNMGRLDR